MQMGGLTEDGLDREQKVRNRSFAQGGDISDNTPGMYPQIVNIMLRKKSLPTACETVGSGYDPRRPPKTWTQTYLRIEAARREGAQTSLTNTTQSQIQTAQAGDGGRVGTDDHDNDVEDMMALDA